jgi:hypothetical protein
MNKDYTIKIDGVSLECYVTIEDSNEDITVTKKLNEYTTRELLELIDMRVMSDIRYYAEVMGDEIKERIVDDKIENRVFEMRLEEKNTMNKREEEIRKAFENTKPTKKKKKA